MFATLVGKSCWRHSGQRAERRHASWNPENSLTTGIGTFPSALLADSPVLPWPSVPKKHFEIKNTDHHSLRIRLHRAAVTEASEEQGEGGAPSNKEIPLSSRASESEGKNVLAGGTDESEHGRVHERCSSTMF